MKSHRTLSQMLSVAAILMVACALAYAAPTVVYDTGFEAADGFTAGDLNSQGGWTATGAAVTAAEAQAGSQSVSMDANSNIEKAIAAGGEVWIIGYYKGAGSDSPPSYPETPAAAAIVHFSSTEGVQCLNGDGAGAGAWVPASGGTAVSASAWTKVALHIVYNTANPSAAYWDCLVNGQVYQKHLGFRNNTVTALNGFKSLSGNPSFFDSLRVVISDGDIDGDGSGDSYEIDNGGDPFDPAIAPKAGDVNGDGKVTALDGIIQYRVATGKMTLPAGAELKDVNYDGNTDQVDGLLIYRWAIGDPDVPFLPKR